MTELEANATFKECSEKANHLILKKVLDLKKNFCSTIYQSPFFARFLKSSAMAKVQNQGNESYSSELGRSIETSISEDPQPHPQSLRFFEVEDRNFRNFEVF